MDSYESLRSLPIQHVLSSLGINQEWTPRKGGTELAGKCPFHQANTNRTSFNFSLSTGAFHCFSCDAKGKGSIDLVMKYRQVGFKEAVDYLKGLEPVPVVVKPPPVVIKPTENSPYSASYEKFYVPSEWLQKRGFEPETLAKFRVGQYNNPNRHSLYKGKIMLPVRRFKDGETVAYLARNPEPAEGEPKYLWPKKFHKSLEIYGAWELKNDVKQLPLRYVYVVESCFAVLKLRQMGFHAVGVFGWAVSDEQIRILGSLAKGCYYLPDRNVRDQAREQVGRLAQTMWVRFPELPNGVDDPEHLTEEQIVSLT